MVKSENMKLFILLILSAAGEKNFEVEEKVRLISLKMTAEGYKIGSRGLVYQGRGYCLEK